MADEDDIASDWDTLKAVPKTKVAEAGVDLRADILDLQYPHPEFVYRLYEGYGLDSMALWKCRCHAKRVLKNGWRGSPHIKEIYLYSIEELLAKGDKYTEQDKERSIGKTYSAACKAFVETLDEAVARWEQVKQKHIQDLLEQAKRHRTEAAERLQWAESAEARAEAAKKTRLKL